MNLHAARSTWEVRMTTIPRVPSAVHRSFGDGSYARVLIGSTGHRPRSALQPQAPQRYHRPETSRRHRPWPQAPQRCHRPQAPRLHRLPDANISHCMQTSSSSKNIVVILFFHLLSSGAFSSNACCFAQHIVGTMAETLLCSTVWGAEKRSSCFAQF